MTHNVANISKKTPRGASVVLHTSRPYMPSDDEFLKELWDIKIFACCVVGIATESWEENLDWICIEENIQNPNNDHIIITSSHPDETTEDVLHIARKLSTDKHCEIVTINI